MKNWYTLVNASRKIGKNRGYLTVKYKDYPAMFEGVETKIIDGVIFVSDNGLELLKTRAKKRGVHLRTEILKWTTKRKCHFRFYPMGIVVPLA